MFETLLQMCCWIVASMPQERFADKQLQRIAEQRYGAVLSRLVPEGHDLVYPSINLWTREEFAALFGLGFAGLSQGYFTRAHVLQGLEEKECATRAPLSHYFSQNTPVFWGPIFRANYAWPGGSTVLQSHLQHVER